MASIKERLRTAFHISMTSQYDGNISPDAYENQVMKFDRRNKLAINLATTLMQYLPIVQADGSRSKVLDVATGTGLISKALQNIGYDVYSGDLSAQFLQYFNQQGTGIPLVQFNMNEDFPIKSSSMDGVTSVWANRFMQGSDHFFSQTYDVLKPQGVLLWPVFLSEGPLWKNNSGWKQPVRAISLARQAEEIGFSKVSLLHPPRAELLFRDKLPIHNIPTYLVAKK